MEAEIHCIKFVRSDVTIDYRPDDAAVVIALGGRPIISIRPGGQVTYHEPWGVRIIYDAVVQDFADLHLGMELEHERDREAGLKTEQFIGVVIDIKNLMRNFEKIRPSDGQRKKV